jgi:hypothetical protein
MTSSIGFTPPPPPRKWNFDLGGQAGMIEETITPNKIYLYDWVSANGTAKLGIMQSETRQSNEVVEARTRKRAGDPGGA